MLARLFRTALGHLGVRGYPKTTGKRGIQIWIPIVPRYTFAETSTWVERVSRAVGSTVPDLISWEWAKGCAQGPGPARLHPEREHQDARRAVFGSAGCRRPGLGADRLGRAGRPRPAARPLDDPRPRRARRRTWRSLRGVADRRPGAPARLTSTRSAVAGCANAERDDDPSCASRRTTETRCARSSSRSRPPSPMNSAIPSSSSAVRVGDRSAHRRGRWRDAGRDRRRVSRTG